MAKAELNKLAKGWAVQVRVIHALMIRELTTRFGRENIGFLWIMAEPLLFAILVAILWRLTKGTEEHGVSVVAFVITGYIPLTLFRHVVNRSVAAFTVNSGLLYHKQITILDFIFTRFLIEVIGSMMAYVFIAAPLVLIGEFPAPANIGMVLSGWFLYCFFCFSLSLVISPLSEMSEVLEKFVPVTTYIMIPFSGCFTLVSWLTPGARQYLLWSPFVNSMELMRGGIWGDEITAYYNPWNPLICSLLFTMLGLILCRRVRRTLAVE
jgi:capsular polysaccharide transport system permease protein